MKALLILTVLSGLLWAYLSFQDGEQKRAGDVLVEDGGDFSSVKVTDQIAGIFCWVVF